MSLLLVRELGWVEIAFFLLSKSVIELMIKIYFFRAIYHATIHRNLKKTVFERTKKNMKSIA